ncbi:transporter substrate-binding domain-containing protein [Breoghania sp.]|uniref:transporter substrate-binding domain-containing protein n=1 Tax=Breoghania sp. TaxID=2065378 RepID=UPI002AAA653C|nr:transporter substrate-binding domain-containing protein [Breoghania sp.]
MRFIKTLTLLLLAFSTIHVEIAPAAEQEPVVPNFWDMRVRLDKPNQSARTIRFLASDDFPPFAFRDPAGRLTGFNVDLARAICEELDAVCTLRIKPFDELVPALASGEGDAIIAGLEPGFGSTEKTGSPKADDTETSSHKSPLVYSAPYLKLPARFVVRKEDAVREAPVPETMEGKWISVAEGTQHEAFLKTFFPNSLITTYPDEEEARAALRRGEVDAHFGDGLGLSYWLQGTSSANCCVFAPGPWLEPGYFDHGMSIAIAREADGLREAIDYALQQVHTTGQFGELYLRYFPISFY